MQLSDNMSVSDYFGIIRAVQLELSHKCPNKEIHTKCPINTLSKEFDGLLPSTVIFDICSRLKVANNEDALIMFHLYNEPTIDCRLCWIIYKIRHLLKLRNPIKLHSSTWGVDLNLIYDLIECGCDMLTFTIPDEPTFSKFKEYRNDVLNRFSGISFKMYMKRHDNRLNLYKGEHLAPNAANADWRQVIPFACTASLSSLIVSCSGEVVLCEYDFLQTIKFGNILKDSYDIIFKRKHELYKELCENHNKNAVDVCSKCTFQFRAF